MAITMDAWVKANLGKGHDYDGAYGVQCVDLVKHFAKNVLDVEPQSIGNAIEYWNKRKTSSYLVKNFTPIEYKKGVKPQKGDIVVFHTSNVGHVSIATGEATDTYFYSYDQNWPSGKHEPMTKIKHTYTGATTWPLGFLRPKDQSHISPPKPKFNEFTAYVSGVKSHLNVRSKANETADIVAKLNNADKVTVIGESGNFYKIKTSKVTGYVSKKYISKTKPFVTYKATVTAKLLNVRNKNSKSGKVLRIIKKGTVVNVYKEKDGWGKISSTKEEWIDLTYAKK